MLESTHTHATRVTWFSPDDDEKCVWRQTFEWDTRAQFSLALREMFYVTTGNGATLAEILTLYVIEMTNLVVPDRASHGVDENAWNADLFPQY